MKKTIILILFLICGCSLKVTVHDEDVAVRLSQKILVKLLFEADGESVYQNTTEEFKKATNKKDFNFSVEQLAYSYPHLKVFIDGYELYGTEKLITIYAISEESHSKIYYALTFSGDKSKGYVLQNLKIHPEAIDKKGDYKKFSSPVKVSSSKYLQRNIVLDDGSEVLIEGVTKTHILKENLSVYTVRYNTDKLLTNHKDIEKQAFSVLNSFGGDRAKLYGFSVIALTASNDSWHKNPNKKFNVYRTLFKLEKDNWVPFKG